MILALPSSEKCFPRCYKDTSIMKLFKYNGLSYGLTSFSILDFIFGNFLPARIDG
jgi:hypothetical protein